MVGSVLQRGGRIMSVAATSMWLNDDDVAAIAKRRAVLVGGPSWLRTEPVARARFDRSLPRTFADTRSGSQAGGCPKEPLAAGALMRQASGAGRVPHEWRRRTLKPRGPLFSPLSVPKRLRLDTAARQRLGREARVPEPHSLCAHGTRADFSDHSATLGGIGLSHSGSNDGENTAKSPGAYAKSGTVPVGSFDCR